MVLPWVMQSSMPAQVNKSKCEKKPLTTRSCWLFRLTGRKRLSYSLRNNWRHGPPCLGILGSPRCCPDVCFVLFKEASSLLSFNTTSHSSYKSNSISWGCRKRSQYHFSNKWSLKLLWKGITEPTSGKTKLTWWLTSLLLCFSNWAQDSVTKLSHYQEDSERL